MSTAEPVGVVIVEVAVSVSGTLVTEPVTGIQGRLVGRVGRVDVERVRGLVGHVNRFGAANVVTRVVTNGAVQEIGYLPHGPPQVIARVVLRARAGSRRLRVALELVGAVVHLVEEAVVLGITRGGVWAPGTHGRAIATRRGRRARDETLLFLQHDEDRLLADSAGLAHLVNDRGCRLVGGPLIRGAHGSCRNRAGCLGVVAKTHVSGGA